MQIPGPTSKLRSTSAASAESLHRSALIFLCSLLVASSLLPTRAEIPPPAPAPFKIIEHISGSAWTRVRLEDGYIGEVDLDEVRDGDLTTVVQLLQTLSDWTEAGDDLELVLVSMHGRTVLFRQSISGVRVTSIGSVRTDERGNVTRLASVIAHPASVRQLPTMTEGEAVEIGISAWRSHVGSESAEAVVLPRPGSDADVDPPMLYLNLADDPDADPEFSWRMEVMWVVGGRSRTVDVNARSGESRVSTDVIIE